MVEGQLLVSFFKNFDFLGLVLRVGIAIEASIGGLSVPVGTRLQLICMVSIVIFLGLFLAELIRVGTFASHWEVSPAMLIRGFHVLIVPPISGKL